MTLAMLERETIKTTIPRAKELRWFTDRVVTLAKRGDDVIVIVDEDFIPNKYEIATLKMPHSDVPNELRNTITNVVISKSLINTAFKEDGVIPPGCEMQPKKRALRQY